MSWAIYWLWSPSQTCHAKPKTQINRRRTLQLLSRWWDAYRKQLGLKDFSPKSQDAVALQQIKERGALPMIDHGDIRRAIDRCSNIWASLPGAGYGRFEHKADSLIAKFKEAGGTVREIDVWASHRDYLRSGYLHHRLPVMGINHCRDNAITYKAQRDKNVKTEAGERGSAALQMRQRDVAALDGNAKVSWC